MTRNNNETRKKANAVFFSAIMVISMFAIGFAGGAAALQGQNSDDPIVDPDVDDLNIADGSQNQELNLLVQDGTDFDNTGSSDAEITFDVTEADSDLSVSDVSVTGAGTNAIGTGDFTTDVTDDVVTVTFNEDDTDANDIDLDLEVTVDASDASVASDVEFDVTADGGSTGSQDSDTVQFDITNDDNPTLVEGTVTPEDLTVDDSTQEIDFDDTSFELPEEGTLAEEVDISIDLTDALVLNGVDVSDADIAGIDIDGADGVDSADVNGDVATITITDTELEASANSIDVNAFTLTGLDTDGIEDATETYTVEFTNEDTGSGSFTDSVVSEEFNLGAAEEGIGDEGGYVDFDADETIDVVFQGQDVFLVGPVLDGAEDETVNLRSVDSFDDGQVDSSSQVEQLEVEALSQDDFDDLRDNLDDYSQFDFDEGDNVVEIDTADLDADDYFVRGAGDLPSSPAEEDTFEVTIQDLDADFDDESVTDGGPDSDTDLDLDSDRSRYSVNTSADGDLDEEELLEVFLAGEGDFRDAFVELHLNFREAITFNAADRPVFETDNVGPSSFTDLDGDDLVEALDDEDAFSDLDPEERQALAEGINALADDLEVVEDPDDLLDENNLDGDLADAISTGDGDTDDFFTVFAAANQFQAFAFAEAEDDEDEKLVMTQINDREEAVDFTDVDDGDYEFDFNVSDTEAGDSDSISVTESDAAANFEAGVITQTAGDLVEVTVELEDTDEAYIQFGDENAGFVDILYIEDDGGEDDEVTFWVNTRLVGSDHTAADADFGSDAVYFSDDDIVESLIHDRIAEGEEGDGFEDGSGYQFFDDDDVAGTDQFAGDERHSFELYLEELDLISDNDITTDGDGAFQQIVRPAQATDYDMSVDENGLFIAEDSESDVDDEIGFATLDLTQPSLGDSATWVGPEEDADEFDNIEELIEDAPLTQRDDVRIDDMLVAQIEASGLYGIMAAIDYAENGNDINEGLEDGFEPNVISDLAVDQQIGSDDVLEGEGISLTFEDQTAVGNQDENSLEFNDEDEVFTLVDNDEGELYIVVDTSDEPFDRSINDGDDFTVELEYETDDDDRFRFQSDGDASEGPFGGAGDDDEEAAYPYFGTDSDEITSTSFTFVDEDVTFDNLNEDEEVQLVPEDDHEISGSTNIAPGSDTTVRVRSTGDTSPSFVVTEDADIESDGSFAATADFGAQDEGDTADTSFRVSGSTVDTVSSVFVDSIEEDVDTPTPEEEEEDTPTPEEEDTPTPEEEEEDTPTPDEDTPDDTDDDTPGFGAVVALVALIAAALLATRRRTQS